MYKISDNETMLGIECYNSFDDLKKIKLPKLNTVYKVVNDNSYPKSLNGHYMVKDNLDIVPVFKDSGLPSILFKDKKRGLLSRLINKILN